MSDSYRSFKIGESYPMETHLVRRLEYIIENTGAKIVISSSWRKHMEITEDIFKKHDFKYLENIIGATPGFMLIEDSIPIERLTIVFDGGFSYMDCRGDQIRQWLLKHDISWSTYVVLEDEIADVCGYKCHSIPIENVVEVDMNEGLSHKNAMDAIAILNKNSVRNLEWVKH